MSTDAAKRSYKTRRAKRRFQDIEESRKNIKIKVVDITNSGLLTEIKISEINGSCYIKILPKSILLAVFKKLCYRTILRCRLVCKTFAILSQSQSLYNNIRINIYWIWSCAHLGKQTKMYSHKEFTSSFHTGIGFAPSSLMFSCDNDDINFGSERVDHHGFSIYKILRFNPALNTLTFLISEKTFIAKYKEIIELLTLRLHIRQFFLPECSIDLIPLNIVQEMSDYLPFLTIHYKNMTVQGANSRFL
jgi:hypothetical protein